jgi:hypothetical protein
MEDRPDPMDPDEAERRFADMLEEAGLPRFAFTFHDPAIDELQLTWEHGFTIHLDLTRPDESPIDDSERAAILGLAPAARITSRSTCTYPGPWTTRATPLRSPAS